MTTPLHLLTVGDPQRLTGGHLYQRRMAEAAPAHGFEVRVVSLPARPRLRLPFAARAALLEAERGGAGAVLLDSIVAAWCAPWLQLRRPTVPVVAVVHQPPGGFEGGRLTRLLPRRLDGAAYRRAALLLVTGEPVAHALLDLGLPAASLRLVCPGTDPPVAGSRGPDLRRGRRVALLCVANWHRRKGVAEAVRAVSALPPGYATLHLVGDQDVEPAYREEVWRLLRTGRPGERVVQGVLPPRQLAEIYAAADVFLLPSTDEPYGMVYGEALAAGLPVVGWRSGNLPRLVESGGEGLLVPRGDLAALVAALRALIEDEGLRLSMSKRARRRAAALPTWEQSAAAFFSAVREALAQAEEATGLLREPLKSSE
jgi:glycosyltransferase involved in cell wall biosynthesis